LTEDAAGSQKHWELIIASSCFFDHFELRWDHGFAIKDKPISPGFLRDLAQDFCCFHFDQAMHYHNLDGFPDFDWAGAKSSKAADCAHFDPPLLLACGPNC